MVERVDESEANPSEGQPSASSDSVTSGERHLVPDPYDPPGLTVGGATSSEGGPSGNVGIDANESGMDTPPAVDRPVPDRGTATTSTNAITPRLGGLRGPDDDIRRLRGMTSAADSAVLGYSVADEWGAMFPSSSAGKYFR